MEEFFILNEPSVKKIDLDVIIHLTKEEEINATALNY